MGCFPSSFAHDDIDYSDLDPVDVRNKVLIDRIISYEFQIMNAIEDDDVELVHRLSARQLVLAAML